MTYTPPRIFGAILLLIVGIVILITAIASICGKTPAPAGVYPIGGIMIAGAIFWMVRAKARYHVNLSSTSGQIHALTSKDSAYIERVVLSINEAIAKSLKPILNRRDQRALLLHFTG